MLPKGKHIREAIEQEDNAISNDLLVISITSGSRVIINSIALIKPCHSSVNAYSPGYVISS
jgi:transcriptional regulator of NAD metabolism